MHKSFWIIIIAFVIVNLLFSDIIILLAGGEYPYYHIRIGIAPFSYYPNNEKSYQFDLSIKNAIKYELSSYGFNVIIIDEYIDEDNTNDKLERLELDFLIKGIITNLEEESIIANIYEFGKKRPRRFNSSGSSANIKLASMILRHISSKDVLFPIFLRKGLPNPELYRNYEFYFREGLYFRSQNDWNTAIEKFQKALEINPRDPDVHYNISKCYEGLGQDEKKLQHLKIAFDLDPFNESVIIALGNHYLNNRKYNESIEMYSKCLDSPYNAPTAHWNLSLAYKRKGDFQKALQHLKSIPTNDRLFGKAQRLISEIEDKEKGITLTAQRSSKIATNRYRLFGLILILIFFFITIVFVIKIYRYIKSKEKCPGPFHSP